MADANQNQNGAGAGQNAAGAGQQPLQVKVPDDLQKGVYANAVSVNVNSNEVVLDFGYLLPNTQNPIIEVVSRINMNQRTAESFLSVLQGAMEDFKKKQSQMSANPAPTPGAVPTQEQMASAPMQTPAAPMPPLPENA